MRKNLNTWKIICDGKQCASMGKCSECDEIAVNLTKNVWLYGLYDIAESWSFCEMVGCKMIIEKYITQITMFAVALSIVWVALVSTCGLSKKHPKSYVIPNTFEESERETVVNGKKSNKDKLGGLLFRG
jgi:hypothetical protein